jgi:hypothetical protein
MTKKMRVPWLLLAIALFLSSAVPTVTHAQKSAPPAAGDDPDFAEFVKKATTKPEFLSPLVDHLPKKAGVPTPKDVLGYHIGTEKKLTYVADQQRYFRALEKSLPGRVKTEVIGKTEEGRDVMVVYVTSEANLKSLAAQRENTRRLADPRGLTEAQAQQLIATTKPHYHISAGLHSAETNPPEAVIELAYRLAVSDEPYIKQDRDNVIVSITGATTSTDAIATSIGITPTRSMSRTKAEKTTAMSPIGASTFSTTTTATSTTASIHCACISTGI